MVCKSKYLDVDSDAIVGKIPNTLGVHGIAIAPDLGRGFVSNGQSSTVAVFDLKTLQTIAVVPGCGYRPGFRETVTSAIGLFRDRFWHADGQAGFQWEGNRSQ